MRKVDLKGKMFNRLYVVSFSHRRKKLAYWNVRCVCGNDSVVFGSHLTRGHVKSCGCLHRKANGMSMSREYRIWIEMKNRCDNPNNTSYKYYGAKGIKVCKRWYNFNDFYADIGDIPKGYSIDRINNDGNYEPSNCKLSTPTEQLNNTSRNVKLTHNGITLNMAQWARKLNISRACLWERVKHNYPPEKMFARNHLSKPNKYNSKTEKEYGARAEDIADLFGLSVQYIYRILNGEVVSKKYGLTKEDIIKTFKQK